MIPETPAAVRAALAEIGLRPRRRWGQNFLADGNVRDAIVAAADLPAGAIVLEVGPGLGILTRGLLNAGANVVAAEVDRKLVGFLTQAFGAEDRFDLVPGDVLERKSLSGAVRGALERAGAGERGYRVVANLPYSSASPFLATLAREERPPRRVLVMVQKEVALRMAAAPSEPDYGPLAVLLSLRGEVRILREVSGRVFFPTTQVRSAVVEFVPGAGPLAEVIDADRISRRAFLHRRKTVQRALRHSGYAAEPVRAALSEAGLAADRRPETLSPEDFVALSRLLGRTNCSEAP